MKRKIYQYQPVNDAPDQSIGILLPINRAADSYDRNLIAISGSATNTPGQQYNLGTSQGNGVFAVSFSTEEQAISNLKNLLGTNLGERYMQPLFGTKIREAIFEQNTNDLRGFVRTNIEEAVKRWLPYINITGVNIRQEYNKHNFLIQISFQVGETGANRVINVLLNENAIVVTDELNAGDIVDMTLVEVGQLGGTTTSTPPSVRLGGY
jgi:phage baseplate assembly protein W